MKKLLALLMALCMLFALGACGKTATETATTEPAATEAPAAEATEEPVETINVKVTLAVEGNIAVADDGTVLAMTDVAVSDANGNGTMDIDDTLVALHAAYCPDGYASAVGDYGLAITKLWNDESGAFGYYVDNVSASSLEDPVAEGSYVVAFVYSDKENYTDVYSYFDKTEISVDENDVFELTANIATFDESWNPVTKPLAGAEAALVNDDGTISLIASIDTNKPIPCDDNGVLTILNEEAGTYLLTLVPTDGTVVVPAVCIVEVTD